MYALVKEILDTSKEKKVDVLVARDMVVASGKNYEEVKSAYAIIDKYYDLITYYRRSDDEFGIENVCKLHADNDFAKIAEITDKLKEENRL